MTLQEAADRYEQALRHWHEWNVKHLAVKAFNAHQFRDADDRNTPSETRMNGAVAELRLLPNSRPDWTINDL